MCVWSRKTLAHFVTTLACERVGKKRAIFCLSHQNGVREFMLVSSSDNCQRPHRLVNRLVMTGLLFGAYFFLRLVVLSPRNAQREKQHWCSDRIFGGYVRRTATPGVCASAPCNTRMVLVFIQCFSVSGVLCRYPQVPALPITATLRPDGSVARQGKNRLNRQRHSNVPPTYTAEAPYAVL